MGSFPLGVPALGDFCETLALLRGEEAAFPPVLMRLRLGVSCSSDSRRLSPATEATGRRPPRGL